MRSEQGAQSMETMGLSCWEGALSAAVVHDPSRIPTTLTGCLSMRVGTRGPAPYCRDRGGGATATERAMESCASCAVSAQCVQQHQRAVCGCVVLASQGALPRAEHLGACCHTAWRARPSAHGSPCSG